MKRELPVVVFRHYGKIVSVELLKKHGYAKTGISKQSYEDIVRCLVAQERDPKKYIVHNGRRDANKQLWAIRMKGMKHLRPQITTYARITRLKYPTLPPDEYNKFYEELFKRFYP